MKLTMRCTITPFACSLFVHPSRKSAREKQVCQTNSRGRLSLACLDERCFISRRRLMAPMIRLARGQKVTLSRCYHTAYIMSPSPCDAVHRISSENEDHGSATEIEKYPAEVFTRWSIPTRNCTWGMLPTFQKGFVHCVRLSTRNFT